MKAILIGTLEGLRTLINTHGEDATVLDVINQIKKEEELKKIQEKITEGC